MRAALHRLERASSPGIPGSGAPRLGRLVQVAEGIEGEARARGVDLVARHRGLVRAHGPGLVADLRQPRARVRARDALRGALRGSLGGLRRVHHGLARAQPVPALPGGGRAGDLVPDRHDAGGGRARRGGREGALPGHPAPPGGAPGRARGGRDGGDRPDAGHDADHRLALARGRSRARAGARRAPDALRGARLPRRAVRGRAAGARAVRRPRPGRRPRSTWCGSPPWPASWRPTGSAGPGSSTTRASSRWRAGSPGACSWLAPSSSSCTSRPSRGRASCSGRAGRARTALGRSCAAALRLALGAAVYQVNVLIDGFMAEGLLRDGGPTLHYYANRVQQFPMALIAVAATSAVFPALQAHGARGDRRAVRDLHDRTHRAIAFVALPASLGAGGPGAGGHRGPPSSTAPSAPRALRGRAPGCAGCASRSCRPARWAWSRAPTTRSATSAPRCGSRSCCSP